MAIVIPTWVLYLLYVVVAVVAVVFICMIAALVFYGWVFLGLIELFRGKRDSR